MFLLALLSFAFLACTRCYHLLSFELGVIGSELVEVIDQLPKKIFHMLMTICDPNIVFLGNLAFFQGPCRLIL